jgi:TrmH family RNA methyltransferase
VAHRFVTSEHNPDIKRVKALRDRRSVRHAERLCIVEGPRFVADAARTAEPLLLVLSESQGDAERPPAREVIVVPDALYARISDTLTPQGMIAVFTFPSPTIGADVVPLILIADGIQDPGNLGTMIRSAAAFGGTGVITLPGTVDPFAPKVIRAAAAAHWQVPVIIADGPAAAIQGVTLVVAEETAERALEEIDLRAPTAIAIGSEGSGISDSLMLLPHVSARIPMVGPIESLNAGVAASIALYEAQRQRAHRV